MEYFIVVIAVVIVVVIVVSVCRYFGDSCAPCHYPNPYLPWQEDSHFYWHHQGSQQVRHNICFVFKTFLGYALFTLLLVEIW